MAIVLDNTLSGVESNSYCDVPFADDYFSSLPNASTNKKNIWWGNLGDSEKQNILVQACYDIEKLKFTDNYEFADVHLRYNNITHTNYWDVAGVDGLSVKADPFQRLQFPRNKDMRPNGSYPIPTQVFIAQCEQAYYLGAELDEDTLNSAQVGIRDETFSGGGIRTSQRVAPNGSTLCAKAKEWLKSFMIRRSVRFERG